MSDITKRAVAGTLESSDVFVEIEPNSAGVRIEIESVVENQFGESILNSAREVLAEQGVESAYLKITDRGALDCVIRARVETAIVRAKEDN